MGATNERIEAALAIFGLVDESSRGFLINTVRLLVSEPPVFPSDPPDSALRNAYDSAVDGASVTLCAKHRPVVHIHSGECRSEVKTDLGMSVITNWEVAKNYVGNALAYAKSGDMATVLHNLELINTLLEKPNEINKEHSWDDFK